MTAKSVLVIGATGDVGSGIVKVLLERGHAVIAAARHAGRLAVLRDRLGHFHALQTAAGSLETEEHAGELLARVRQLCSAIDAVIVSVNTPREPSPLLARTSDSLAALLQGDVIAHFAAARTFIPAISAGGILLGIGGGSCDFILRGGVPQSAAQAALRMLYRGLASELASNPVQVRELIIASIVNGASTRGRADPLWVTDTEIGAQVSAIVENPAAFPEPILRMARRDGTGRPVFSAEPPIRIQGFS
jgi:NAD(P)-dependent dehydrogenase (short-subunit alcohol dehydrogenase family)